MLCDRCHKREACVHIQEVRSDSKRSLNLCVVCALAQYSDKDRKLQDFLGVLTAISQQLGADGDQSSAGARPELSCPKCRKSQSELKKSWLLGCDGCVSAFREPLREQLVKLQRLSLSEASSEKTGAERPDDEAALAASPSSSAQLSCLRRDLQLAIQREQYEEAARLRDRIDKLLPSAGGEESDN